MPKPGYVRLGAKQAGAPVKPGADESASISTAATLFSAIRSSPRPS
jgi:hypothetical protein